VFAKVVQVVGRTPYATGGSRVYQRASRRHDGCPRGRSRLVPRGSLQPEPSGQAQQRVRLGPRLRPRG
jgi:hypothetical protein